ncbi:prepilin-type N-terminal cleavage/methylation domain-containing protein [Deinococcus roseus]|uniref:Prepilin-type N-terminal cleavage/methylation domain-containing protein n=1 Tax=Deinococcus roseus TaxID=392414 RepID=A0ABQ2DJA4_9DEIO|nr:prepilin-type N-terminal cleavage/methylation domain-containing protein [Deinococcus roseus]GGJ56761.1 hypothetical protein GCM10008938_48640 [Deinococcus roseus]
MRRLSAVGKNTKQRSEQGFTLLELLLAMAIMGMLLVSLFNFVQTISKTSTDVQGRINAHDAVRRLAEMVTQELRSTAFGVVASQPYAPNASQISVLSPVATSGNTVAGIGVIDAAGFSTATTVSTYTGTLSAVAANSYLVLLSGSSARLLRTTAATSTSTSQVFTHTGCQNVLSGASATLSLVTPVGYRYDSAAKILYEKRGANPETILAWGISNFALSYTYVNTTTGVETTSTTFSGALVTNAGSPVTTSALRRINLLVGMTENGKTQTISNTVNLISPTGLNITSYTECV